MLYRVGFNDSNHAGAESDLTIDCKVACKGTLSLIQVGKLPVKGIMVQALIVSDWRKGTKSGDTCAVVTLTLK